MIRDEPIAQFTCPGCGNVTVVFGDDDLVPKDGQRCVRCLDPRHDTHDEFVRAEREATDEQIERSFDAYR